MDILEKIDNFLNQVEFIGEKKYIQKDIALTIIEKFIEEVPEDKILLEMVRTSINRSWSSSNNELLESFYKILAYYGIITNEKVQRKTVLENKGKTVIRKFITLKNKQQIYDMLELDGR